MTHDDLWEKSLATIELSISKANFSTWFKNTSIISHINNHIVIGVPNGFAKEWLENKYQNYILKALREVDPSISSISCSVLSSDTKKPANVSEAPVINRFNKTSSDIQTKTPTFTRNTNNNLNTRYSFDTFIVGEYNELAKAACVAVSENIGKVYNPLFIYGNVGLGKTHLLQSIGNAIAKKYPEQRILYTTSEKFTTELINSIKNGTAAQFKNQYKKIDLLIIDDVQFLSGKEKTQQEFFHIFNTLYQEDKQIVISSDRPPKAINTLSDRLRSRFEGGMIVDIGSPDLETRIAILKEKASQSNFYVSDDSIHFIAENIKNNVRELEGALNRVKALCDLQKKEPTIQFIKNSLAELIESNQKRAIQASDILDVTLNFYEISKEDLFSKARKKAIVHPRQVSMYLIRSELNMSYPGIGKYFGGRDHTTVLHSYEKIAKLRKTDKKFNDEIEYLLEKIYKF